MRDTFGNALSFTIFGESHGAAIGGVISGIAPGVRIDENFIAFQMEKRRAKSAASTKRTEADKVEFLSGVKNGFATGSAIAFKILNTNTKSKDYEKTQSLLRPGHADFTAYAKYKGFQDARGGGHFSGRLTAPVVAAGSIFFDLLAKNNIKIGTQLLSCANITDTPFSDNLEKLGAEIDALNAIEQDFATIDTEKGKQMFDATLLASQNGDSVGGVLQTCILGLPAGLGEPFFTSIESVISQAMFSIPAVKGIEFGLGFKFAQLNGSSANDEFYIKENDSKNKILTKTNNNAGINGGISNGMPIIFRTVVKPTPSIFKQQQTVDYDAKQNATLQIQGRHDPCIAHRARVVQDSFAALAIADLLNMNYGTSWQVNNSINNL